MALPVRPGFLRQAGGPFLERSEQRVAAAEFSSALQVRMHAPPGCSPTPSEPKASLRRLEETEAPRNRKRCRRRWLLGRSPTKFGVLPQKKERAPLQLLCGGIGSGPSPSEEPLVRPRKLGRSVVCSCFSLLRLFFEVRVVTGVGCATAFVLPGRASKLPSTLSSLQVYRGEVARGSSTNPCSSAQPVQWDWRMLNDRCECALDGFFWDPNT